MNTTKLPGVSNTRGFTLFQLIGVLVAVAIVATVALQVVQTSVARSAIENARTEMREIGFAIVGNPNVDTDCGYIGDVGELPPNLNALIHKPDDVCDRWNGPYIEVASEDPNGAIRDPWGREYIYEPPNLYIKSNTEEGKTLVHNFADSYDQILNNQMTIVFNVPGKTPAIENGCEIVQFTRVGETDRWLAEGLTQCPGDIFYYAGESGEEKVIRNPDVVYDVTDSEQAGMGIIQYVNEEGKKAHTKGSKNHIVDYTAEYTGDDALPVRQIRITWKQFGNYWASLSPKLASLSVDNSELWNHGDGPRLSNGGVISFDKDDPFMFDPDEMNFDAMVFEDLVYGNVYNVDMRGTEFTVDYWPASGGEKQTITFRVGDYTPQGQIVYTNNLVTSPGSGIASNDPLSDDLILAAGDIDIAGNHQETSGDIRSNDDITITGNTQSEFCGNMQHNGSYSASGQGPDLCEFEEQWVGDIDLPSMGLPWSAGVADETEAGNYTLSGNQSYENGTVVEIVSGGSLTIDDATVSGNVTFVVDGGVDVAGDLAIDSENGGQVIILAGGNVTTSGGNGHTVDAYIHADGTVHISGNDHEFAKLLWVDGSAQIAGNSNDFGGGIWAGGSMQYTNNSGTVNGIVWSGGSMHIAASDKVLNGAIICGGDLQITGSRLNATYVADNVKPPISDEVMIYDLDFDLENPTAVDVYVDQFKFTVLDNDGNPAYLSEAIFNGTVFHNAGDNRLTAGEVFNIVNGTSLTDAVQFSPGAIDNNQLNGFYLNSSGDEHLNVAGKEIQITFYEVNTDEEHVITIPVPGS